MKAKPQDVVKTGSDPAANAQASTQPPEASTETEALQVTTVSMLLGDWVSSDDPRAGLSVSDSMFAQSYDGEVLDKGSYVIADAVAASKSDAANPMGRYITVFSDSPPIAYYVIDVSANTLSLSYVGRGNTLNYTRIDTAQILQPFIGRDYVYGDYKFSISATDESAVKLYFNGGGDAGSTDYNVTSTVSKGEGDYVLTLESDGDESQIELAFESGTKVRVLALKNFHWWGSDEAMVFEPR